MTVAKGLDQHWYKDAIIYEVHVRAFGDSNSDGIGDFKGLINRLGYLQNLGINTIWLLPFYPSPLKDDGYDIANYYAINPDYGNIADFKELLKEAHNKNIKVIAELVLNHTSSEHKWFQRARHAEKGTKFRNMYVWSDTPNLYRDARIIFKDFESSNWSWDPVANEYYWHRFYSHQPDLNFDNPYVHQELFKVIDFWFSLGLDGLRLDAVPYLYERNNTNCENLKETHDFLKKLRAHVDSKFTGKMLLAEANQWPEDAAAYFGEGDECHMAFHFPLMPRMFMAIQMEDSFPIIDILKSTPAIPNNCQWSIFLRNHDELTLEMVTDEERDYMYLVYAKDKQAKINLGIRRRLSPLLSNDRRKIELMNILLFSLPGTPIIYYGDEIGMGDNFYLGDRNGVRTPMQWSPDRNAGFSTANPHRLFLPVIIDPEYHYEALNVQNQETSISSLLWWMRNVIGVRKRFKAFSRGAIKFHTVNNAKILCFSREFDDELILVIVNLSRFSQIANIDLFEFIGLVPEEMFGHNQFPVIREHPYMLSFGPFDYYWLNLKKTDLSETIQTDNLPAMYVTIHWQEIFKAKQSFEEIVLPKYLAKCRWFASKARKINRVIIIENGSVSYKNKNFHFLILRVIYSEGAEESYLLPITFGYLPLIGEVEELFPYAKIALIHKKNGENGIIYDSTYDEVFNEILFSIIYTKKKVKGIDGFFLGFSSKIVKTLLENKTMPLQSRPLKVEQSNTSILYEDIFFLKFYRKLYAGLNPELEVLRFLSEKTDFKNAPEFAGTLNYTDKNNETSSIAILQRYVANNGNAWNYSIGVVTRYFENILSSEFDSKEFHSKNSGLFEVKEMPDLIRSSIGEMYLEMVSLLGKRTAELHLALGSRSDIQEFAPEDFSQLYQRSVFQSMQALVQRTYRILEKKVNTLPFELKNDAIDVLSKESKVVDIMKRITRKKISCTKIRIHGDYHLGQVLYTGKDFVIMDFEGEPARSLSERKLKRSPFRDIAGMIRSFHYVAYGTLFINTSFRPEDFKILESWIPPWYHYVSGVFLNSYLTTAASAPFVPKNKEDVEVLLLTFLLEKAVYELGYEINNRPDWVIVSLRGLQKMILE